MSDYTDKILLALERIADGMDADRRARAMPTQAEECWCGQDIPCSSHTGQP